MTIYTAYATKGKQIVVHEGYFLSLKAAIKWANDYDYVDVYDDEGKHHHYNFLVGGRVE